MTDPTKAVEADDVAYWKKEAEFYAGSYAAVQRVLDRAHGTSDKDGHGQGIAAGVDLLRVQRDDALEEAERYHRESRDSARVVGGILRVLRDNGRGASLDWPPEDIVATDPVRGRGARLARRGGE